jgi:hypothetical protein
MIRFTWPLFPPRGKFSVFGVQFSVRRTISTSFFPKTEHLTPKTLYESSILIRSGGGENRRK